MARVGFRGLGKYQDLKLAELDQQADKLADRVDAMVVKGGDAIKAHHRVIDGRELEIAEFEKAATDLSNGAPPLDDLALQSPHGNDGKTASEVNAAEGTQATTQGSNAQVTL